MRSIEYIPRMGKTTRELISSSSIFWFVTLLAAFAVGGTIGAVNPILIVLVTSILVMAMAVLLRLDELTVVLIVAAHIWLDVYLNLYVVGVLMALVLVYVCYRGRSATRPWTRPRLFWFWIAFLVLTIYPAINGARVRLADAESFYVYLVLSPFILFWLGNIVAKDTSSIRKVFSMLAFVSTLIAIHTIIEATTGTFLFESAFMKTFLAQNAYSFHVVYYEMRALRAGSFFGGPNDNAAFLVTSLFLPLGLFVESKELLTKAIYLLETLLILLALIFTYSTGAWIAVLGGIFLFAFLAGGIRYGAQLLALTITVAVIVLTVFHSQVAVQVLRMTRENTFALHVAGWETAIKVIKAFPLTGIGMGGPAYLVRAEPFRVAAQTELLREPDNSYLQWGAMAGIPVMLLFLLILGCTFWFAWRNWLAIDIRYRPLIGGGIAALVALSIDSLSVGGWTSPAGQGHFGWLIAGIVASPLIGRSLLNSKRHQPAKSMEETIPVQMETVPVQMEETVPIESE